MAFSQSIRKGQVLVNCKLCDTVRPIQWKCMDCNILMCSHCKDKVHSQFKNANDHKIISREEIGLHKEELDFTNIKCDEHTGRSSCLYCNTCEILVCPTCVAKIHKKHDLIEISEAYNMKVEILKKEQNKMQKSNSNMNYKQDEIKILTSAEYSKYSKVRDDILTHEKTVKLQVEKYFKKLKKKLEQSHETVLTSFKIDQNALSAFTNQTEDQIKLVQDFVAISNASEFFKQINMMQKSTEIKEPLTKSSYCYSPNFVPGNINQSNIGSFHNDNSWLAETNISLVINDEYQTELEIITNVCPFHDHSLWISSGKYKMLQRVHPEGTSLNVMYKLNIDVCDLAVTPSNQILLVVIGKTRIQQISSTGELTDSVYDVTPLLPNAIHVTSENKVIVGAYKHKLKRSAVIIMNKKGDEEAIYEHDKHNQSFITNPWHIAGTSNGNIHVVDKMSNDFRGKVVVLGQGGNIINTYTGHPTINTNTPFKPVNIVTTPNDNVVVIDWNTDILHILNDNGHLISYFNTNEIGIEFPWCLAFNNTGQLYIGCTRAADSKTKEAKLYKINIEGF